MGDSSVNSDPVWPHKELQRLFQNTTGDKLKEKKVTKLLSKELDYHVLLQKHQYTLILILEVSGTRLMG